MSRTRPPLLVEREKGEVESIVKSEYSGMADEQIKERIRYYTEWLRLLWITLLGLSGGISGLVLTLDSPVRVALLVLAVVLGIGVIGMVLFLHRLVLRSISRLKGEKT